MTLTYLASQNWVLDSEKELAAKFEAETGIHVDYQIIPADQYFTVLQTKLESGGDGIDIFGGQSGKTDIQLQLGVEKNAVPVTDEEWVQRMDPLTREQISLGDTVYGQTIWDTVGGSWVVVYNKSIFEANGIAVPSSYDELAAACSTLSVGRDHADLRAGLRRMASRALVRRARPGVRSRLARARGAAQRQRGQDGRRPDDATRAHAVQRAVLERLLR